MSGTKVPPACVKPSKRWFARLPDCGRGKVLRSNMELIVHAVIVPPMKCGLAFAHAPDGSCITFTGERAVMVALCEAVRLHNMEQRDQVCVRAADWQNVAAVPQRECPAHYLQAA